nr:membrane protein insertion efficiency factor YidD [Caldanaerobius fijiensis]
MIKRIVLLLIRFYQIYISPIRPGKCRFRPTCSQYTLEAVQKYGVAKGLIMGLWRILRCNPFCKGGYDPLR